MPEDDRSFQLVLAARSMISDGLAAVDGVHQQPLFLRQLIAS